MNLRDRNLSLQLYNYLCDVIGSEDVVKSRREIFTEKDIVESTTYATTVISSGSRAEGLDLEGSDYDQMIQLRSVHVYESFNNVQYDPDKMILVMDTNDTKPGFSKLKLVNKSDLASDSIHDYFEDVGDETYISSKSVREKNLIDGMIINGPCQSTPEGDYDSAKCVRCNAWISPARHWIHRSRTSWPHYTLITAAVQYGVLFVPIGCKNSPNEDLQWRISFSVTEKLLIHSFSHTQLLCYALMKIILKDIIKPRHGDRLCSYFIKTIMFWLSEEIRPTKWKPNSMLVCVLECIGRLIYCVEYKTCLHYFIPENNLFEDRFTGNDHKALLDTLRFVYGSPLTSVFHTDTFLNYRSQSENSHLMALSASALSCFSFVHEMSYRSGSIYRAFKRFGNINKEIYTYILCICSRKTLQLSESVYLSDKNTSFYKQYKRFFCHFKISLQSDSVYSWLLLASLFYKCKRFRECLDTINYCLCSCTPDKIHLHYSNSMTEQTVFKRFKQKFGLFHAFKYFIIENLCFYYPFCLLPDELMPLIDDNTCSLPPVVYSYLLQFLCCFHFGDYRGKHNALHDLELTIRERYLIFPCGNVSEIVNKSLKIVKALL